MCWWMFFGCAIRVPSYAGMPCNLLLNNFSHDHTNHTLVADQIVGLQQPHVMQACVAPCTAPMHRNAPRKCSSSKASSGRRLFGSSPRLSVDLLPPPRRSPLWLLQVQCIDHIAMEDSVHGLDLPSEYHQAVPHCIWSHKGCSSAAVFTALSC